MASLRNWPLGMDPECVVGFQPEEMRRESEDG